MRTYTQLCDTCNRRNGSSLLEVSNHVGGLEDHFADLGEHADGLHQGLGSELIGVGRGEVEDERVVVPVKRRHAGWRRQVVNSFVKVVGPPGRMTKRMVADHLHVVGLIVYNR